MLALMERMHIEVLRVSAETYDASVEAWVLARSERRLDGRRVAEIVMHLALPAGANAEDARELALEFLDPE